jgi:hypothetical protein
MIIYLNDVNSILTKKTLSGFSSQNIHFDVLCILLSFVLVEFVI